MRIQPGRPDRLEKARTKVAGGLARSVPRQRAGGTSDSLTPLNLAIAAHEDSEGALAQLTKEASLITDDPALERVRKIGGRLAEKAGILARFELFRSDRVNAYAIGNVVALTLGAYRLAGDDDGLAGLLAHEVAHLLLDKRRGAAALAACRVGRGEGEFEADRHAIGLLAAAGFKREGLLRFLLAFEALLQQQPEALKTFTHPPTGERIKRLT